MRTPLPVSLICCLLERLTMLLPTDNSAMRLTTETRENIKNGGSGRALPNRSVVCWWDTDSDFVVYSPTLPSYPIWLSHYFLCRGIRTDREQIGGIPL